MTVRKPLLLIHIVSSVGLLGSSAAMLLLAVTAATTPDRELAHSAYRLMSAQSLVFGIPLSFTALLSGLALGLTSKWGVLRYRWTAAKLLLILLTIVCGATAVGPQVEARLAGGGSAWGVVAAVALNVTMLATATGVSVFRPRGRLRRARRPATGPSAGRPEPAPARG